MTPNVFVAIPAMCESEYLPKTLNLLFSQKTKAKVKVFVCINQPESYWSDEKRVHICEDNSKLFAYLNAIHTPDLKIIDRSSCGNGWLEKKSGVGHARRELLDNILQEANNDDVIISLDADTLFLENYIQSVIDNFSQNKNINAISVPYYHKIDNCEEKQGKAILRYELYMRNYLLNLLMIDSPYAFTALGSAIAIKVSALKKIGNITPFQSGEDFYLLQKIAKMGGLSVYNSQIVYPSSRPSDRVPFGTGPAVTKGMNDEWNSYPIFHHSLFEPIDKAYKHLHGLYENNDSENSIFLSFLEKTSKSKNIWTDLKNNVSDYEHFAKAFHQKADGLKILQFVREQHRQFKFNDYDALVENLAVWFPNHNLQPLRERKAFSNLTLKQMDNIRNMLYDKEMELRQLRY